jgi:glycerate-2-kinase
MKAVREEKPSTAAMNGPLLVLLDNNTAITAARDKATALGFSCTMLNDVREQPIAEGCELLLSSLMSSPTECIISGGEFSCPVRGDGRGGRNLETALRCAVGLAGKSPHLVVLSAGTDGIDGNSPAAGAVADETTIQRAGDLGLDANQYLARSDSYSFFESLGDLLVTGPTGTNVRDLRILLRSPLTPGN